MRWIFAFFALALATSTLAQASFPSKPVTMVVGFEPGGGTDTVARIVAKTMSENIGQQVVVENRAGAGGNIAVDYVAKSTPDGYTVVLANVGALAVNPHLLKVPYDPLRDLTPLTMAVVFANVLVVQPSLAVSSLAEYVKLAREKPATVTYASSGIGGAGHLAGELLKMMAQIDIVHVPFNGIAPAVGAVVGGQVQMMFAGTPSALPQVKAGRLVALGVASSKRIAAAPELPTLDESGLPGFDVTSWYGIVAPAGTPHNIVDRLQTEIAGALAQPDVREKLAAQGAEPIGNTPAEFAAMITVETAKWGKIVKDANIRVE